MKALGAALLILLSASLHAGEFRVATGAGMLATNGAEFQVGYRPGGDSHWVYAIQYTRWAEDFDDPFTGNPITRTTHKRIGPQVSYLFHPERRHHWYVGVSVLQWSKAEHSLVTGETGTDKKTSPYFGGGYTGTLGKWFYYNAGVFLSPGVHMKTETSVSSEEDSGAIDGQLQIGLRF